LKHVSISMFHENVVTDCQHVKIILIVMKTRKVGT